METQSYLSTLIQWLIVAMSFLGPVLTYCETAHLLFLLAAPWLVTLCCSETPNVPTDDIELPAAPPWRCSYPKKRRRYTRHYFLRRKMANRTSRFPEANRASEKRENTKRDAPVRKKKQKRTKKARIKPRLDHSTPNETEAYHDIRHRLLPNSMVMYGMQLGVDLQSFVESIDPIKNFRTLAALSSGDFITSKSKRKERKKTARAALIAAANLQGAGINPKVDCCFNGVPDPEEPISKEVELDIAALTRKKSIYFSNRDNMPIVIDTGASLSLTPNINDFIGDLKPAHIQDLNGLSSKTTVVGVGRVRWTVCDLFGVVRNIETTAYYVPEATIRLFSPQSYFQENDSGKCIVTAKKSVLILADETELEFPHNPGSNLPLMLLAEKDRGFVGVTYEDAVALGDSSLLNGMFLSVADETNQNLTGSSRELLL
jgi:hypothetical protein